MRFVVQMITPREETGTVYHVGIVNSITLLLFYLIIPPFRSSLSKAFYVANAILIPAVILFIIAAITYPRDRTAFLRSTSELQEQDGVDGFAK